MMMMVMMMDSLNLRRYHDHYGHHYQGKERLRDRGMLLVELLGEGLIDLF